MSCNKEEHNDYISGCVFCEIDDSVKRERERIIKLLKDSMAVCDKNKEPEGCEACYGQRDAIALIKGNEK